jgi:hypothetical protein
MHPINLSCPVDIAGRDLRQCDKGDAGIAEIREANGIPGRLSFRLPAAVSGWTFSATTETIESII